MRAWPLALLLLLAPFAGAQAPDVPVQGGTIRVAWTWTPAEVAVEQGSFLDLAATADVTFTDAVCPQGTVLRVSAVLAPEPETTGLKTDPLSIEANVTVPGGAYGGALPAFAAEAQVPFRLLVDLGTAPGAYELLPSTAIVAPQGCAPAGAPGDSGAEGDGEPAIAVRVAATSREMEAHPDHEEHGAAGFDFFLEPGATRGFQYNVTGTFTYHDHFKPELKGTVVVEESGPSAAVVQVTAQGFNPAEVRVGVRAVVNWTNADRVAHTISADELHPEHAAAGEDPEGEEPMDEAPPNATEEAPASPPANNRSPGPETGAVAAALGLAAWGRARRGARR